MKFYISLEADGDATVLAAAAQDTVPMIASPRAGAYIYKLLLEQHNICLTCGLIVRTDELVDNTCKDGVGCRAPEEAALNALPQHERAVRVHDALSTSMTRFAHILIDVDGTAPSTDYGQVC